jgi:hypothetical protein
MISKIFELPFSANADGFLKQMTEVVTEYKKLVVNNDALFYELRVKSLKYRFEALKACKKNFIFNDKTQSEYADLVIQFNNANAVNTVSDVTYNDTKQSLLGEFY